MSAELTACEQFLYSRLTSDIAASPISTTPTVQAGGTLDVLVPGGFHSERNEELNPPGRYILWTQHGTPLDVTGEGGVRFAVYADFLVRVIDKTGDFSTLAPAADRMDAVINRAPPQSLVVNGKPYTMRYCVRKQAYSRVEPYVDVERRHLGGIYTIWMLLS